MYMKWPFPEVISFLMSGMFICSSLYWPISDHVSCPDLTISSSISFILTVAPT